MQNRRRSPVGPLPPPSPPPSPPPAPPTSLPPSSTPAPPLREDVSSPTLRLLRLRLRRAWGALTSRHDGSPRHLGDDWAAFDAAFDEAYVHVDGFAFGCTVVALGRTHGVVHQQTYGGEATDTIYAVHSMTKIVTTIACLQLRDRGLLTLDDPIAMHLPSFREARTLDDRRSTAPSSTISIRHCLNHTSGLSYYWTDPAHVTSAAEKAAGAWALYEDLRSGMDNAAVVDSFWSRAPALFAAGSHYNYAGGHCIVAAIVQRLSGQAFTAYLRENILQPLGMSDTTYTLSPEQARRLTPRCPLELAALPLPWWQWPFLPIFTFPGDVHVEAHQARGDAGLKGTARDWSRLALMLLRNGELDGVRVLSAASVAEMTTSSVGGALIEPPFGFQGGVDDSAYEGPPVAPAFRAPEEDQHVCRGFNYFPGHSVGLGLLTVEEAERATLDPAAQGTAWWCGFGSTYIGVNRTSGVGVLLLGHQFPTTQTRTSAFRDVINAAHRLVPISKPKRDAPSVGYRSTRILDPAEGLRAYFTLGLVAYHCAFFTLLLFPDVLHHDGLVAMRASPLLNPMMSHGLEAPNVLLMLSGFFTTSGLLREMRATPHGVDVRRAILRRYLRLLPLVALPTLAGVCFDPAFALGDRLNWLKLFGHLSLTGNLFTAYLSHAAQWQAMFSLATAPVWSLMVDLHATSLLVLLVPRAYSLLGGATGVRRVLCVLIIAATVWRYQLVHSLILGSSCPWHAYIRAYTPQPMYSGDWAIGFERAFGYTPRDVPLASMPNMPMTRSSWLRPITRSLGLSDGSATTECTASVFEAIAELSARTYNPSHARIAPVLVGAIVAVNHLDATDRESRPEAKETTPAGSVLTTLRALRSAVMAISRWAAVLMSLRMLHTSLASPLDYMYLHYAPDGVIAFAQTFWPLANAAAVATLIYAAIAPLTSPWYSPIAKAVLSLRPLRPLARHSPWMIMLHCPVLLLLLVHRVVPRLHPALDAPSLTNVFVHCALVLALTMPLAILCTDVLEPAWKRASARLLDATLGQPKAKV